MPFPACKVSVSEVLPMRARDASRSCVAARLLSRLWHAKPNGASPIAIDHAEEQRSVSDRLANPRQSGICLCVRLLCTTSERVNPQASSPAKGEHPSLHYNVKCKAHSFLHNALIQCGILEIVNLELVELVIRHNEEKFYSSGDLQRV